MEAAASSAALARLKLRDVGKRESALDIGWYGLSLRDHYLIIGSGWDHLGRIEEAHARELSRGGRAFFWSADDTPMTARAAAFADGAQLWSLTHDGTTATEGPLPEAIVRALAQQRERQDAERDGVDHLYEAAHVVGDALFGFRHDVFDAPEGASFAVLRPADEPEPTRAKQEHPPFSVDFVGDYDGSFKVWLEATKTVELARVLALHFDDEGLRSAAEFEAGRLAKGERRSFVLPDARSVLCIDLAGFWRTRRLELRVPAKG